MARDLQRVIDAVLDGVVVVDEDARVEFLNAEACRILETSAEAATMARLGQVVGPDHALAKLVQTVFATGRSCIENERRVRRRFDEDLLVDIAASPLFEDDRSCSGVVLALRDRTIQRTLAEWVSEREQLQAFGQIAAARGRSHSNAEPARPRMNFLTGQPTFRSIQTAPASSRRRHASPRTSGSEPKS